VYICTVFVFSVLLLFVVFALLSVVIGELKIAKNTRQLTALSTCHHHRQQQQQVMI